MLQMVHWKVMEQWDVPIVSSAAEMGLAFTSHFYVTENPNVQTRAMRTQQNAT